jgi:ABC-2 type transport system ATP-binding protein
MNQNKIEVKGLNFAYAVQPVLKDLSFCLEPAAIGLLGPNGSGKTTLLRALLGHLNSWSGQINCVGFDMSSNGKEARKQIGWMPERGGILTGFSGVGMVAYLGELSGMPQSDALQRAHEVLNFVGLADQRYRQADTYSQGMRQRLKLAQALVHDPKWLLLDEPTSGLDPQGRTAMLKLIKDLAGDHGFGIILSTHLLSDVREVCSEILVLRDGELLQHTKVDVSKSEVKNRFQVEGVGDYEPFISHLQKSGAVVEVKKQVITIELENAQTVILEAAKLTGFSLRRMEPQTDSVEDVFFNLVDA